MKATKIVTHSTNPTNQVSHFSEGNQIVPAENSTSAYLQSEELFSIVKDSLQTKETSLQQVHYNDPDNISVRLGFAPIVLEIPDEVHRKIVEIALELNRGDSSGERGRIGV